MIDLTPATRSILRVVLCSLAVPALVGIGLVLLAPTPASAQAPQTFSFQGRLSDNGGDPVPDASRNMTFRIYDAPVGGSQLWMETQSIATSGGIYVAALGSVTSFDGFDFNRPLWLGVQIEDGFELAPRTPLLSVPTSIGLVHPYKAVVDTTVPAFWLENVGSGEAIVAYNRGSGTAGAFLVADPTGTSTSTGVFALNDAQGAAVFGLNSGIGGEAGRFKIADPANTAPVVSISNDGLGPGLFASSNAVFATADISTSGGVEAFAEDVTVYAEDAIVGLYSANVGSLGSGFSLGEMDGGLPVNKWAMVRKTTHTGGDLKFNFGSDVDYGLNPTRVEFDTTGQVTASSFHYAEPKVSYFSTGGAAINSPGWNFVCPTPSGGGGNTYRTGVYLPQGAEIMSVSCTVRDNESSADQDITCRLSRMDIYADAELVEFSTTGAPGATTITAPLSHEVDNNGAQYFMSVTAPNWAGITIPCLSYQFIAFTVEYTTTETL